MRRMWQTLKFIALFFSTASLYSCNNDVLKVNIESNTLGIKLLNKTGNTFTYSIYNKDETIKGRLPEKLDEVKLNNKILSSSCYSYSNIDGKFIVSNLSGKLSIKAELLNNYLITLNSETLSNEVKFVDINTDLNLEIKVKDNIYFSMPDTISSVQINGTKLDENKYTYNKEIGLLHVSKQYITGNITINAEAISKSERAYKVTFECDSNCSVFIYETPDYSKDPIKSSVAFSVDKTTGELSKGNDAQVNFKIVFEDDYDIEMIFINGLYKNCKGKESTLLDDVYKITKIKSDLNVKITTSKRYLKDFSCVGDSTNQFFDFSWSIRDRSTISKIQVNIKSDDINTSEFITSDNYRLSNVKYNQKYSITFKPISTSGKVLVEKNVIKMMLNPNETISMPKINITTKDGIWPRPTTTQYKPMAIKGYYEGKDPYINSSFDMYSPQGNLKYSTNSNSNSCKIKVRGNTSAIKSDKKPYKLKFDSEIDLLEGFRIKPIKGVNYKNKEWNLVPYSNNMSDLVGFATSRALEFEYSHEYIYVVVFLNDDYQGLYFLSETNDVGLGDGDCQSRYKISDTGFLIENDFAYSGAEISFPTLISTSRYRYTFKHPDPYEKGATFINEIQNYIIGLENLLIENDNEIFDYIDLNSFARWIVSFDIIGQNDNLGANRFLYKYDSTNSTKLKMGTPWDFSNIFSSSITTGGLKTDNEFWFKYLFNFDNFKNAIKSIFTEFKDDILNNINNEMNLINKVGFDKMINFEKIKYNFIFNDYDNSVTYVNDYISNRLIKLNQYYQ